MLTWIQAQKIIVFQFEGEASGSFHIVISSKGEGVF